MTTYPIIRCFLLVIMIFPFSLAAQSTQQNSIRYTTTEIKKEGDKCKIGQNSPIYWCKSPCEKMYGKLPNVNCPN